uniref:hypothetical protein n=1 Tax=Cellulomonas hominis TaxID=156981 RepID=UPI001E60DD0B
VEDVLGREGQVQRFAAEQVGHRASVGRARCPARAGGPGPVPLRPAVLVPATAVLLGLLGWFVAEAARGGGVEGLAERAVAGAESLAPLALVLALLSRRRAESSLRLGAAGGLRG